MSRSAVEQEEEIAFAACDSDQVEGLTWEEVEQCEVCVIFFFKLTSRTHRCENIDVVNELVGFQEKYLLLLTEVGIEAPSKADFEAADLDGNGTLLLKEWKDWAAEQI